MTDSKIVEDFFMSFIRKKILIILILFRTIYLLVRKNLEGLISRNVFYQLVQEANLNKNTQELYIESAGERFSLGKIE